MSAEINQLQNKYRDGPVPGDSPFPLFGSTPVSPEDLPPDTKLASGGDQAQPRSLPSGSKVCIVGAGMAGLYIAMILDSLAIPGLSYEILEASSRIGGRIYTHRFSSAQYDYYDVGAMRFPKIKIMDRTFDLFNRLAVPQIPYYLDYGTRNTPSRYNDIVSLPKDNPPAGSDVFKVSIANKGSVPDATVKKGVDAILEEAFGPFKLGLEQNWAKGFQKLMEVDEYSTRQYLSSRLKYDFFSIQWMETHETATGLFDQAFSESVIDSFDFDTPTGDGHVDWTCIAGGTSVVTEAMRTKIKGRIELNKRVNRISHTDAPNLNEANMRVRCADEPDTRSYVTVFNTTSLGCLQRIDLTEMSLHPSQKDAIRCLHYDNSTKVAIKFSRPWWKMLGDISNGGSASTDMPLRTCVYPSYNLSDMGGQAVLLCSYTWSQDAVRVGSLVNRDSPKGEEQLKELILDDLAKLHQRSIFELSSVARVREMISLYYVSHHAFSWANDPYTSGAFALVRIAPSFFHAPSLDPTHPPDPSNLFPSPSV